MTGWPRKSHRFSAAAGAVVFCVGALAFAGWVTGDARAERLYFDGITVKTNTAIALAAVGLALLILSREERPRWQTVIARGLAVVAIAIGVATLAEHILHVNLGIDELLFAEAPGMPGTSSPNRMGPPACVAFPLLGMALLWLDDRRERICAPHQWMALLVVLMALVPVLGYIFDVHQLYGIAQYTGIALLTALSFLVGALGVLLARPESGLMRRFLGDNTGGMLFRRMIPAALVLPIVLGRLRVAGQQAGLYDEQFGRSLLILSFILLFSGLTVWVGLAIERQTAARTRAEDAEHEMRERLAESLASERAARALAERSNRLKDEFLATLSHELRTPLSAISGWVQLLQMAKLSDEDTRRALETIYRNAQLQSQLIEDLLEMSRIEAGTLRLQIEDVDLATIVESVCTASMPSASAKGVTLEWHAAVRPLLIRADPSRVQQIVNNLVSNAIKFTLNGGRVTVTAVLVDGAAEVDVADTGIGISADFMPYIFDRFRQADGSTTRSHGGLGLGLSIAKQLTDMHGGTLSAESDGDGRGATFRLRLPTAEAAASADETMPIDVGTLTGARVLVVDDQQDVRDLAERVLTTHGATVTTAAGVDQAMALDLAAFDVLVTDIGMPGQDGYDLIRRVRAKNARLPAIALTAFARPADSERTRAAGFQRHLSKPVPPDRLVRAVASLARDRPLIRQ